MTKPSTVFTLLSLFALALGAYMVVAPTEGRPDYAAALIESIQNARSS
jgi:hypothetical protein